MGIGKSVVRVGRALGRRVQLALGSHQPWPSVGVSRLGGMTAGVERAGISEGDPLNALDGVEVRVVAHDGQDMLARKGGDPGVV